MVVKELEESKEEEEEEEEEEETGKCNTRSDKETVHKYIKTLKRRRLG